ncbi:MAG: bifunctional DNA primase/helicase [Cyanobacteria bacterium J06621_11]
MFKITDHVEFNSSGRASCPSCEQDGKGKKLNLALVPNTDGAYKCHRGCTAEDIRSALGIEKPKTIPTALQPKVPPKKVLVTPQKVKAAHTVLMESNGPAKQWLIDRGIDEGLMAQHRLGVVNVRVGKRRCYGISIPMLDTGGTSYQLKKRVAPWDADITALDEYQAWKQYGVPKRVWFTYEPEEAMGTWLCEGEWDAMLLGKLAREANLSIAIACFTTGCSSVPPASELEKLLGTVTVFYDRNDTPLKNGDIPGDVGSYKAAIALRPRGRVAKVPMPDDCTVKGWDVSDAINNGCELDDFIHAANHAIAPPEKGNNLNGLIKAMVWNDDLINNAPDYTEFLVPDLLTEDELFLLAAGPRTGKSLLAMTLAKAVATGGQFMGRPCTQGTVVYVKCEDSDTKIKERQQAQDWGEGLPVAWLNEFKLSQMQDLEALIAELDPRLLVLDTLSRIKDSGISESSAEMSQLLEPLQQIANKYGCCVLLVHHTGKVSTDNANNIDIFNTIRGSSAIRAVCRGSMILAAGERSYRLVVENGWGKHDLKVVLDANTLTWRQIGEWRPPVNLTQQEQIVEALKKLDKASVEQLYEETGIPKKSLYEQLSRLVNSEIAGEKVIKEGSRRKYTYSLALFNTSQQLNSVLNSGNPGQNCHRGPIQQNTFFPRNNSTTQISTTDHVPVEVVENSGQIPPRTKGEAVDYRPLGQSQ